MESIFINEAFDSSIKEFIKLQKESDEVKENSFAIVFSKKEKIFSQKRNK